MSDLHMLPFCSSEEINDEDEAIDVICALESIIDGLVKLHLAKKYKNCQILQTSDQVNEILRQIGLDDISALHEKFLIYRALIIGIDGIDYDSLTQHYEIRSKMTLEE